MPENSFSELFSNGLIWFAAPCEEEGFDSPSNFQKMRRLTEANCRDKLQAVRIGLSAVDNALPYGGLPIGAIHEFFPLGWKRGHSSAIESKETQPACILPAILAAEAWRMKNGEAHIVWIGKNCWPSPFLLEKLNKQNVKSPNPGTLSSLPEKDVLASCLFTDPQDTKLKLWAIETALRSKSIAAVVTECGNLRFALSRRMALAAEAGNTLGLFIRPSKDKQTASSALTRWQIRPSPSPSTFPRFELELLKCKGRQPSVNLWVVETNDSQGVSLHIPSDMVYGPAEAAQERFSERRRTA